jgi:hypothetical protein
MACSIQRDQESTHEHLLWFSRDQTVVLLSFSSLQIQVRLNARLPFPEYNRGQGADIVLVHVGCIQPRSSHVAAIPRRHEVQGVHSACLDCTILAKEVFHRRFGWRPYSYNP